jgi:hypothetical protein
LVCGASLFGCSSSSALFAAEKIPMHAGDMAPLSAHCRIPVRVACFVQSEGWYTLVTLPRTVTPYRDSVDGTRDHVTYQKFLH